MFESYTVFSPQISSATNEQISYLSSSDQQYASML